MTPYQKFSPIIPPRTTVDLNPSMLPVLESKGWWAQLKRNGTNSVIFVPPDGKPFVYDRRGKEQRQWRFISETALSFEQLPPNKWHVFNAELLHNKTKTIKEVLYLFDILVYNNNHLTGSTYLQRYQILSELFERGKEQFGHYEITNHLWLARNYTKDFSELFASIEAPEDEGLMLKDRNGVYRGTDAKVWMAKFLKVRPQLIKK